MKSQRSLGCVLAAGLCACAGGGVTSSGQGGHMGGGDGGVGGAADGAAGTAGGVGGAAGGVAGMTGGTDASAVDRPLPPIPADAKDVISEVAPKDSAVADAIEGETAPPVNAGPCTALFCEDFEKGAVLDSTRWNKPGTSGTKSSVVIQDVKAAHGTWAAKFHAESGGGSNQAFIYTKRLPVALQKHFYGRAYMLLTAPGSGHNMFLYADNVSEPAGLNNSHVLEIGGHDTWAALAYYDRGFTAGGKILLNRWLCVEFEFNDQPDTVTLWVDGKQELQLKNVGSGILGTLASAGFGHRAANAGGDPPIDVYVDDIALDDKRVGCIGGP